MIDLFNELYARLTLASPDFFVKVRKIFLTIAAAATAISESGLNFEIFGFDIPKIIAIATAAATLMTFFPVKDTVELESKIEKKKA